MRFAPILAAALICSIALPAQSATPSFKCTKATREVEDMICKDGELAALDRELAAVYSTLLDDSSPSMQRNIKAEQRAWLKDRNDCWRASDQRGCIFDAYQTRIEELGR
jgi:uncharacterized protein